MAMIKKWCSGSINTFLYLHHQLNAFVWNLFWNLRKKNENEDRNAAKCSQVVNLNLHFYTSMDVADKFFFTTRTIFKLRWKKNLEHGRWSFHTRFFSSRIWTAIEYSLGKIQHGRQIRFDPGFMLLCSSFIHELTYAYR